ncbi:MAG TPA: dihydrolipoamide acetyltransferase family protein, partial [Candidatus Limnocylindrales bacterium]|nr:dihydrolipoamide acetyltransferase family protein [Candidatus Limnocylindrales bacterium]
MASVTMPQLGESITEGTISKWLKQPGDQVKKYESLVEVITDKVNAEVPSPLAGTLKEIKVPEGTTVAVGTEICVIDEVAAPRTPAPSTAEGRGGEAAAQAEGLGGHAGMIPEPMAGPPRERTLAGALPAGNGRNRLSPAVRAIVDEHRLSDAELAEIPGSGIGGRISKKDVEAYLARGRQPGEEGRPDVRPGAAVAAPAHPSAAGEPAALSPMRRAIAANMTKSKQTIPHAWTVAEVDMTAVVRQRQQVREAFKQREGIDLTFVPIVIKGVVESLRANPILNASFQAERVVLHKDINIGVAVAIEDGLI